jgi:hypothetical protein
MKSALLVCAELAWLGSLGCRAGPPAPPSTATSNIAPPTVPARAPGRAPVAPDSSPATATPNSAPAPKPPLPDDQAMVIHDGRESWINLAAAQRSGYTIIDFSDDWTPFIFAPHQGPDGAEMKNRYRYARRRWRAVAGG